MGETQQIQLNPITPDRGFISPLTTPSASLLPTTASQPKSIKWWVQISFYSFLILAGQSTAVILGRLYYEKGGQSKWMTTLIQFVGFPILIPLYYIFPTKNNRKDGHDQNRPSNADPSVFKLGAIYISLGLLLVFNGMMYAMGILYLPVSTFSLISASQLAFTAFFAFFLVGQKLTPYIMNSLVILTISSVLLVFHNESSNYGVSKAKYAIGFVCAVGASAGIGLMLPLTQYFFQKVIKRHGLTEILNMIVNELLIASCAAVIGLFVSGEWRMLKGEMQTYMLGRVSYLMTLIFTAISWQVFYIGSMKLLIEVSSLFTNVIGTLGLPIVPVLAVFIFHDKMDGIKAVALVLAIWGFVSYAYQCYLDNQGSKTKQEVTV